MKDENTFKYLIYAWETLFSGIKYYRPDMNLKQLRLSDFLCLLKSTFSEKESTENSRV